MTKHKLNTLWNLQKIYSFLNLISFCNLKRAFLSHFSLTYWRIIYLYHSKFWQSFWIGLFVVNFVFGCVLPSLCICKCFDNSYFNPNNHHFYSTDFVTKTVIFSLFNIYANFNRTDKLYIYRVDFWTFPKWYLWTVYFQTLNV